jgi:hypothetical protein
MTVHAGMPHNEITNKLQMLQRPLSQRTFLPHPECAEDSAHYKFAHEELGFRWASFCAISS